MLEHVCFHGMLLTHNLRLTYKMYKVGNNFSPTDSTFSNHIARYILVTTKVHAALFLYTYSCMEFRCLEFCSRPSNS